jgi:hypothetical protein
VATYRRTRNIEASIIDYIVAQLASASWTGINVVKGFEEAYGLNLPVIAVRSESSVTNHGEIGDNAEVRDYQVLINIFATDDGMRLDLKDFLIEVLRVGCVYYEYTTQKTPNGRNTVVHSKTANGRIRVLKIGDTSVKFDIEKDKLTVHDRYRHLLSLTVNRDKIE